MRDSTVRRAHGPLAAAAALAAFMIVLAATAVASGGDGEWHSNWASPIVGQVQVAGQPSAGWRVELHAGSPRGSRLLDTTVSGGDGKFRLRRRPT
ncbi:MAG: hypothetical protein U9Q81_17975, partial [Pseudomonadota bacterium]|nr:hypothetical protein [Pseudomonadota bacterium]